MIDANSPKEVEFQHASINWIPAFVLIGTPIASLFIVPWYLWTHSVKFTTWAIFAFFMVWTGMSITTGYHRLLAHRSYQAHPLVKLFLVVGATFSVQSSAFDWCAGHRHHHRFVDDEYKDPYSSRRGFLFSHMGWMLRKYSSGKYDYKNIPDLKKDKLLRNQHKYYGLWVAGTNLVMLPIIGWISGDILGVVILAGLLRLVISHHLTFFINSLCHMFGTRPYTDTNTARDNFALAIFTWGEGYHNYHHFFQYDYRNGVKWWQYDPTKWLIMGLNKFGLTYELRTVDDATIKHAQLEMKFKNAQNKIDMFDTLTIKKENFRKEFDDFKIKIYQESQEFQKTMEEWQALKTKKIEMKKTEFSERLQEVDDLMKEQFKQIESRIIEHSEKVENALRNFKTSQNINDKVMSN